MRKNLKSILIISSFILVIIIIQYFSMLPFPNVKRMERLFQADRKEIYIVRDYLMDCDFDSITIRSQGVSEEEIEMFTGLETGRIPVDDEEAEKALRRLFKRGYQVIGKEENAVDFLRGSIKDKGWGIVYSANGNVPDESILHFITEVEPLTEDKWYYYVEDFDEWKRQNED